MAFWNRKKPDVPAAGEGLDRTQLPQHVGIIMDGNGRWAKKRGLPRTAGHAAGAETFRTIAYYCRDIGIPYLTVYAFSTENWKRPVEEVATIMDLLHKYLLEVLEKMERDGFRVHFFGNLEPLPPALRDLCLRAEETAASLSGKRHQVNICLNYGGRDEILRAAQAWGRDLLAGRQTVEDLTDEAFSRYLDSRGMPDPDLIIRPSGELRLSNFLTWQSAYAEFYFTDVLWPDFTPQVLDEALAAAPADTFVIGGESLYRQTLDRCDTVYVTKLHRSFPGADRFFPNLDQAPAWILAEVEGPYVYGDLAYTYCTYHRRKA